MYDRRIYAIGLVCSALFTPIAFADGLTPEEAAARMVLPSGFSARVFAAEPMIRQPVAGCFDARGRMWVIEYLQYPNPAGLKPVTVDQYLRTEYDRVPDPPPRGPRGADRIKILEDVDGDGRADKATVFVDGLNLATGLAVGHGGVYVGQAPYLLFYPDRDGDDRPDGDPKVLLTGFGMQDAHATVNSMAWGPDGWLYGAQGSTVTARIRGVEFQQGVWRFHPKSKAFELFAEGGGNTWGLDWDKSGNAFGSSNGGFVAFHMVQGGNYWKGFAKHGALHNPRAYGYFDALPYDGPRLGGHVTPGGIIYKGDAYPESFRGAFIGGNLLANTVYWHDLRPEGSTFRARHGGTLIDARDAWFRPIDLFLGPDGCVYVVDWYDRRASHLDPRDTWDKTNGRIYRVIHGEPRRVEAFDLSKLTTDELVDLRTSPNDWQAETARRILAERHDPGPIPRLKRLLADDRDEVMALRDLWAVTGCGGLDDATSLGLLDHPVAGVRRWTVRLLGDDRRMNPSLRATLTRLAASDPDPLVRSQLASSCQRWRAADALPIIDALLSRPEDADDRHLPLLLWWACERQLTTEHDSAVAHMLDPSFLDRPLVDRVVLGRLARLLISGGTPTDDAAVALLLARARTESARDQVVSGMLKGLEGRKLTSVPRPLEAASRDLMSRDERKLDRVLLAIRLGNHEASGMALRRVQDPAEAESIRVTLLEVIGQTPSEPATPVLIRLILEEKNPAILAATLAASSGYNTPEVAAAVLGRYRSLPEAVRSRAIDLLTGRKPWAARLIDAIEAGQIPAKDVRPAQVGQIVGLGDKSLAARLESAWGRLPGPGSPEKVRRIAEVRGLLVEGDRGDAFRGHAVFVQNCAPCHRLFNEGEKIGPELTQSERTNLDFLLTSIVDPGTLIRKEFQSRSVELTDGRVLTGLVADENDRTITLVDSKRRKTVIPLVDVEASRPSDISLMPDGLIDTLKEEQIRDLFKYLRSSGPSER